MRAGPAQQPDGTAKTHEAKLVLVWTGETRNPQGRPVRDPASVSYSGAIESAARRMVLGDGAAWIWNLSSEQFPGAIQIVDLWHAKEHLWEVSKALHAGDAGRVEAWARARCHELEAGRLDYLLQVLRSRAGHCEPAQRCADYVERNRDRMRYAAFRAQGLCVASGVVEAGCKTVIGTRLKRAGMHWTVAGANAIIALRCCKLSGRYEDFWESRSPNS